MTKTPRNYAPGRHHTDPPKPTGRGLIALSVTLDTAVEATMRTHYKAHSFPVRSHTVQQVELLNGLVQTLVGELGITEPGEQNEVLARVLALHGLGKTSSEITKLVMRLHSGGAATGRRKRKVARPLR